MNNESVFDLPSKEELEFVLAQHFDLEIEEITKILNVSYAYAHGLAAGMRLIRERMNKMFSQGGFVPSGTPYLVGEQTHYHIYGVSNKQEITRQIAEMIKKSLDRII